MRGVVFIARTDLRNMFRSRETLLWIFVMPIVFFYFIGTVTSGYGRPGGSAERPDPLVVEAPADAGPVADEIVRELEAQRFGVERARPGGAPADAARVLTLPAPASGKSFSEAVVAGEVQRVDYRSRAEGATSQFERVRVARAVYGVLADLVLLASEGRTPDAAGFQAVGSLPRSVSLVVESAGHRKRAPSGFEQAIPGTMVMFTMLVSLTTGAILLVIERRLGLLRRLAAAPLSRSTIVAGKWVARVALAALQIAFAMLAGTLLFGMSWGASLPMVALLLVAWAAFNASLALLFGSLARTEGQMVGLGVLSSMGLAALGGCWWPIEIAPRWMQSLALFLPTGWAMDAMHRLVSFGDPASAAVPHVAALLAGALVLGAIAARAFRYA
jgi:ABC-type multidrug transport system permease subunit